MTRIRGDASKLRRVSRRFRTISEELSSLIAEYDRAVKQTTWEGRSRKNFNKDYHQWERDLKRRIRALKNISQDLKRAAFRLEQADQGE